MTIPPDRILVVDDAPDTVEVIRRNLEGEGYLVHTAGSVAEALELLDDTLIDLVITDYKMPRVSGMELVRHVRENLDDVEVVMITGYASVEGAVAAVKTGAEEYLPKPFTDAELLAVVRRALDKLRRRRAQRREPAEGTLARFGMLGASDAMRRLGRLVEKASSSKATVLITGESGTGKELLARAIHYGGPRAGAPFVPVNCGGIPSGLIERELFGHMKGAFTGAGESRMGFFQAAQGGTLFLDEISEMESAMQVKILRVLQEREFCMVGDTRQRQLDIRVVAATNKDLSSLVAVGRFREDLFYRLNVLTLEVPPLRERTGDVPLLVRHLAARFAEEWGRAVPVFTDAALAALEAYDWPGNVRELENTVQRVVLMAEGDTVEVSELPPVMRFCAPRIGGRLRSLAEVEREHVRMVLAEVGGNKTRAAEVLGIDRKTLRAKLGGSEG
ncbi:MAG: sigma-54 dependent transcriptional regulator [Pseudomonadota bacterium]